MVYYFFSFFLSNICLTKSISRSVKIYRKRKKITTTLLFHIMSVVLGLLGLGHLFFAGLSGFCYSFLFKWESQRLHSKIAMNNMAAAESMGIHVGLLIAAFLICFLSLIGGI